MDYMRIRWSGMFLRTIGLMVALVLLVGLFASSASAAQLGAVPDWNSKVYRNGNTFYNSGYAPAEFYPNGLSPRLGKAKGNCTWYAHGRVRELGYSGADLDRLNGPAGTWGAAAAGLFTVDGTPAVGDIAESSGHVAVVEKVNSGGTILISESSFAESGQLGDPEVNYRYRTRTVAVSAFAGYINVFPSPAGTTLKSAVAPTYNTVKLTWATCARAEGYTVYRATSSAGSFTAVKSLAGASTLSFTDAGLNTGTSYSYKVRAYRLVGESKVYGSYSGVKSAQPMLATVQILPTIPNWATIGVRWSAVTGATGYQVYRSTSSGSGYSLVKTLSGRTSTSYDDSGLAWSRTYYYKVRACRAVGSGTVFGPYSAVASGRLLH